MAQRRGDAMAQQFDTDIGVYRLGRESSAECNLYRLSGLACKFGSHSPQHMRASSGVAAALAASMIFADSSAIGVRHEA